MSLTPRDLFRAARDRHPALNDRSTPDSVLLTRLNDLQREVAQRGVVLRPDFLQQKLVAAVVLNAANALGTAGAGVGAFPAVDDDGQVSAVAAGAGSLARINTERDPDFRGVPDVLADDALTFTGQAWTVDEWQDAFVMVTEGPGLGSVRPIVSNTADTVALDPSVPWSEGEPTAISVFGFYASEPEVAEDRGVTTAFPSVRQRAGYMVKLDAAGNPYLDTADPVMTDVTSGIPLPPNTGIGSQGLVYFTDGSQPVPMPVSNAAQRFAQSTRFAAVLDGDELVLAGVQADWQGVKNIEVPYTPVPPDLTSYDDLLLLPDATKPLLVGHLAAFTARRLIGRGLERQEWADLQSEAQASEEAFMATLMGAGRARKRKTREVW